MKSLKDLSNLYANFKIYPGCRYDVGTPVGVFNKLYPHNYYSKDLSQFLILHNYEPTQRGSDLPWWGCNYFSDSVGKRVMIISQDSLSLDAGSIAFWAHLFGIIKNENEYKDYTSQLTEKNLFRYSSWSKVYNQLTNWNLDLNYCFITDAAKVYNKGSWKDRDFDKLCSTELLISEIEFCHPDLIIILGSTPLTSLAPNLKYSDVVDTGKYINTCGIRCVVSPFIIGNGPTQLSFKERLVSATSLITKAILS